MKQHHCQPAHLHLLIIHAQGPAYLQIRMYFAKDGLNFTLIVINFDTSLHTLTVMFSLSVCFEKRNYFNHTLFFIPLNETIGLFSLAVDVFLCPTVNIFPLNTGSVVVVQHQFLKLSNVQVSQRNAHFYWNSFKGSQCLAADYISLTCQLNTQHISSLVQW